MRSSWKSYFIVSGVALASARLLLLLFRPHSYPVIDSMPHAQREAREPPAEVVALVEAGIHPDSERDAARKALSARLIQLAHDANVGGTRDVAKVAYEADEAALHDDCARLGDRMRALEELARATSLEDESALLARRTQAICGVGSGR